MKLEYVRKIYEQDAEVECEQLCRQNLYVVVKYSKQESKVSQNPPPVKYNSYKVINIQEQKQLCTLTHQYALIQYSKQNEQWDGKIVVKGTKEDVIAKFINSFSNNIIFQTKNNNEMKACANVIQKFWPNARFEDAESGRKLKTDDNFDKIRELCIYKDAQAETAWDTDKPNANKNLVICLIARNEELTVIPYNTETEEIKTILNAIKNELH